MGRGNNQQSIRRKLMKQRNREFWISFRFCCFHHQRHFCKHPWRFHRNRIYRILSKSIRRGLEPILGWILSILQRHWFDGIHHQHLYRDLALPIVDCKTSYYHEIIFKWDLVKYETRSMVPIKIVEYLLLRMCLETLKIHTCILHLTISSGQTIVWVIPHEKIPPTIHFW